MKYKVWGKAASVIKPKKQHFAKMAVFIFSVALIVTMLMVVRLAYLYSGTIYQGETTAYLQMLGTDQVTVRWRSEKPAVAEIRYGHSLTQLDHMVNHSNKVQEHALTLTGLEPNSRYFYQIIEAGGIIASGDDYQFKTAPLSSVSLTNSDKVSEDGTLQFWILGDPGEVKLDTKQKVDNLTQTKRAMKAWLLSQNKKLQIDMLISTGDNSIGSASRIAYQKHLFNILEDEFKQTGFWPVYGDVDANGWSFFKLFNFPTKGELGGYPSGSERYYSINYGDVHFIFLDSIEGAYTNNDTMLNWLKNDLKQIKQKWTIALMHHPAYSRGSHNSNDPRDSSNRMFNMRIRVAPLLEAAGVDLVLAGHSHAYERSYLIDCHYGLSSDFTKSQKKQAGPIFKKPITKQSHDGTVYAVVGSSSTVESGKFDHPAMAVSKAELGSLLLEVKQNQLIASFVNQKEQLIDQFQIHKTEDNSTVQKNECGHR